jgi:hypothetical protein
MSNSGAKRLIGGWEDEYSRRSDSANKATSDTIKIQVIGRLIHLHNHSSFLNLSIKKMECQE